MSNMQNKIKVRRDFLLTSCHVMGLKSTLCLYHQRS